MAKIVPFPEQVPKQLELPLKWWQDVEIWRKPHLKSAIERPVEDDAINNVKIMAGLAAGAHRTYLTNDEIRVYKCSLSALQHLPIWYDDSARYSWISRDLGLNRDYVEKCLRIADSVMENLEISERMQTLGFPEELPEGDEWVALARELLRAA